jgi:hypothetical protein
MIRICKMCGGTLKPDATKCSCCGCFVEDVAVDRSALYANYKGTPAPSVQGKEGYYSAPRASAPAAPSRGGKCSGENVFANTNWKDIWAAKRASANKLGIILTNTEGCINPEPFMQAMNSYIDYKAAHGVEYYVLDIKSQLVTYLSALDVEELTAMLYNIYTVAVPDYLMIVGDSTVIPNAEWYNVCGDGDETVPSDLAYITLDPESPWDGAVYDFENITQVGRIPASPGSGFATAIKYFNNTKAFDGYSYAKSFAYSALVWEQTSRVEFAHLNPYHVTSPRYTAENLGRINSEYNFACFNLHGSDESHAWYGQEGWDYPEAFNKDLLPQSKGYALLSEACYGARPLYSNSMVVSAIENNCIAFVGSSMIAYGYADGSLCCADIIAQSFTKSFAAGATAGNAFLGALSALFTPWMCEQDIKTLAEFALYGDPSVTLIAGGAKKAARRAAATKCSSVTKDSSRGIKLLSCDGENGAMGAKGVTLYSFSEEEQAHIKKMASHVSAVGKDYVLKKCSAMSDVQPKVFKVIGKEEYRAVYTKNDGKVKSVVAMHLDGNGNVKKVYHSK